MSNTKPAPETPEEEDARIYHKHLTAPEQLMVVRTAQAEQESAAASGDATVEAMVAALERYRYRAARHADYDQLAAAIATLRRVPALEEHLTVTEHTLLQVQEQRDRFVADRDRLLRENERLRTALEIYADADRWSDFRFLGYVGYFDGYGGQLAADATRGENEGR